MAITCTLLTDGYRYLVRDDSQAWSGTPEMDESLVGDIVLKVGETTLTVLGVVLPTRYPEIVDGVMELEVFTEEITRNAVGAPTITITWPNDLFGDGTRTAVGQTDLAVSNRSMDGYAEADWLDDTVELHYYHPTLGTLTGTKASPTPHVRTDAAVGGVGFWRAPVDMASITTYPTLDDAMLAARGSTSAMSARSVHVALMVPRGLLQTALTTLNGNNILDFEFTGGVSPTEPFMVVPYDDGEHPSDTFRMQIAGTGKGGVRGRARSFVKIFDGVEIEGDSASGTPTTTIGINTRDNGAQAFEGLHLGSMWIHHCNAGIQLGTDTTPTSPGQILGIVGRRLVIEDCYEFCINGNPSEEASIRDRTSFREGLFRRTGQNDLDHIFYGGSAHGLMWMDIVGDDCPGAFMKLTHARSAHAHRCVVSRCLAGFGIHTNGTTATTRTGRDEGDGGETVSRVTVAMCALSEISDYGIDFVAHQHIRIEDVFIGMIEGGGGSQLIYRNDAINGTGFNASVEDGHDGTYRRITGINSTGVTFTVPVSDVIGDDDTIGYHEQIFNLCIFMGDADASDPIINVRDADYQVAKAAGRIGVTMTNTVFFGGASSTMLHNGTSFDATTESGDFITSVGSDFGLTFVDPGITRWYIHDYCRDVLGYEGTDGEVVEAYCDDLRAYILAVEDEAPAPIPTAYQWGTIVAHCFDTTQPTLLDSGDFGGAMPGVVSMAMDESTPPTLSALTPALGATDVSPTISSITVEGSENLTLQGAMGNFYVYAGGVLVDTVNASVCIINVLDKTELTIPRSGTLGNGKAITVRWDANAVRSQATGVPIAENTGDELVAFTTLAVATGSIRNLARVRNLSRRL